MTPHQVLSLMTQDQTADLMTACCNYLSPERIAAVLREGLEHDELIALRQLLVDLDEEGE